MRRMLEVDPSDPVPIWRQIEEGIRRLVAAGGIGAGDAVPSVRELARQLGVNPATVVKGYQRLVEAGVLAVRRGEGTFVADGVSPAARRSILEEGARRYASLAIELGADREEAMAAVRQALEPTRAAGGVG